MASNPKKMVRKQPTRAVEDAANVQAITYNRYSGGFKNLNVGPYLQPLHDGSGGFTTDASAAKAIAMGSALAVYNNSNQLHSITFGEDGSVTVLASGVASTDGRVGHPCKPNDWTYFSNAEYGWVIAQSANLMVFIMRDDTNVQIQG